MKEDCLEDERSIAKNDELWRLGSHNWYIEQSRYKPNQMERVNDVDKKKDNSDDCVSCCLGKGPFHAFRTVQL